MGKDDKSNEVQYSEFNVDNSIYITEVPESYKNRKAYEPENAKELPAAIPGTIFEIFVEEGQSIEIGQDLLILEAMKMKNQITSFISGEIKKIHCKPGDIVRKGQLLIEFK